MKFTVNYDALMNSLENVATVVEDKLLDESLRNVIFRLSPTTVHLLGYSQVSICKSLVEKQDYNLEFNEGELKDDLMYIQVKSKEFNSFLGTFKNLKRTKPDQVVIDLVNNKIRCMVFEKFTDEEEDEEETENKKKHFSVWTFDNLPVKENVLKGINIALEEGEGESVSTATLLIYINTLLPLVADDGATSVQSKLSFGEDYVFSVTSYFVSLFKNNLPPALKGVTLSYSAVNFLKKILSKSETVTVNRTSAYVTFRTDNLEAYMMFNTKISNTDVYLQNFKKDHCVTIDRQYFRDVLKRLSVISENSNVEIDASAGVLRVKNTKFNQDVPLLGTDGMDTLPKVAFKLATNVLDKAIIGDDSIFDGELKIYINPLSPSGYVLCFTDDNDLWFSIVQVK